MAGSLSLNAPPARHQLFARCSFPWISFTILQQPRPLCQLLCLYQLSATPSNPRRRSILRQLGIYLPDFRRLFRPPTATVSRQGKQQDLHIPSRTFATLSRLKSFLPIGGYTISDSPARHPPPRLRLCTLVPRLLCVNQPRRYRRSVVKFRANCGLLPKSWAETIANSGAALSSLLPNLSRYLAALRIFHLEAW